jgi:hypothetical protein
MLLYNCALCDNSAMAIMNHGQAALALLRRISIDSSDDGTYIRTYAHIYLHTLMKQRNGYIHIPALRDLFLVLIIDVYTTSTS